MRTRTYSDPPLAEYPDPPCATCGKPVAMGDELWFYRDNCLGVSHQAPECADPIRRELDAEARNE